MNEKIMEIIKQYVNEDTELNQQTNLITDIGLTSFDLATMAADFEDEFGITIETDEMIGIRTVADISDCIQRHL